MAKTPRPIEYDITDDLDGAVLPDDTALTSFNVTGQRFSAHLSAENAAKVKAAADLINTVTASAASVSASPAKRARGSETSGSSSAQRPGISKFAELSKWTHPVTGKPHGGKRPAKDLEEKYDEAVASGSFDPNAWRVI